MATVGYVAAGPPPTRLGLGQPVKALGDLAPVQDPGGPPTPTPEATSRLLKNTV
jgi:hypothetical protein